jgi:glutathione S-transferase
MKLYFAPQSRATRPRWLLEELGIEYELVRINLSAREQKSDEYLKVHPHGLVPALVDDDDETLIESGAICLYLADKYPEKNLAPPVSSPLRGPYYQWCFYTIATMEPVLLQVMLNTVLLPPSKRSETAAEDGKSAFVSICDVLQNALAGKQFLLGDQFTAADVLMGSTLNWAHRLGLLHGRSELLAYLNRLMSRPAFERAQK